MVSLSRMTTTKATVINHPTSPHTQLQLYQPCTALGLKLPQDLGRGETPPRNVERLTTAGREREGGPDRADCGALDRRGQPQKGRMEREREGERERETSTGNRKETVRSEQIRVALLRMGRDVKRNLPDLPEPL